MMSGACVILVPLNASENLVDRVRELLAIRDARQEQAIRQSVFSLTWYRLRLPQIADLRSEPLLHRVARRWPSFILKCTCDYRC